MVFPPEDHELRDWLRWAEKDGSNFLQRIAEAASIADAKHYILLRPILLKLRQMYPETSGVLSS